MTAGTQPSPGEYIYEPYPALMKSGAFKTIAAACGVGIPRQHPIVPFC